MMVKILPPAVEDLTEGCGFYEKQSETLGLQFLVEVAKEIDSLEQKGGIHAKHFGFHRLLVKKFPFAIYYQVEGSNILV
jgi:hypothetical protein